MKKILILLTIIFLLSGCYDYVEINDLVIISGMIIDYKNNKYEITSQIIENESETKVKVYTTTCDNIDECLFKISKLSNKDIFISHLKTLILTESLILNKKDFYDYFLRETKSKMNFNVYFIEDKYKEDILNIYKDNNGSALYIKELMNFNNNIFSSSTPITFLDLIYRKLEYGIEPIYPNLKVIKNNNETVLYLDEIITYNDNNKKITLNDTNGIYYNIIKNKLGKTVINIPCDKNTFSVLIENSKSSFKLNKNGFNINTNLKVKINSYNCKYDLDNPKDIDTLSKLINNHIKNNIEDVINIAKENNVDFIGIGNYIYKHNKKYFDFKNDNWNNHLKEINVNIKVKTIINSIGELKK